MALEVDIDRDVCMGSGNCVAFVVDPSAAPEELVVSAARKCPTTAISVLRDGVTLA
jgi:ferredoxin